MILTTVEGPWRTFDVIAFIFPKGTPASSTIPCFEPEETSHVRTIWELAISSKDQTPHRHLRRHYGSMTYWAFPHISMLSTRLDVVYVVYWSMRDSWFHGCCTGRSIGNQSPYVHPAPANRTCPCQESELIHSIISIMRYVALWLWLLPLQKKRWAQSRQRSAGIWVERLHSLKSSYCNWPRAKLKLGSSPLLQWIYPSQPPHLHISIFPYFRLSWV